MRNRPVSQARHVLIDSSAYFALLNNHDASHSQAVAINTRLIAEGWRLFNSSFILAETHALLLNRLSHNVATKFLQDMEQSATTILWVTPADAQRATELIYQYDDKNFSLTDATSFAIMERLGLRQAFAFDRHFTQYGFEVLVAN